jgi:hypothetical protein
MPKILKKLDKEWAKLAVPEALFPEPDHSAELDAAEEIEQTRTAVRLRGIRDFPEELDVEEGQETQAERVETRDLGPRRGWDSPMTASEIDHDHDCDQPSHTVSWMRWLIDNRWPPPRDYTTCRGYGRLRARKVSELR